MSVKVYSQQYKLDEVRWGPRKDFVYLNPGREIEITDQNVNYTRTNIHTPNRLKPLKSFSDYES